MIQACECILRFVFHKSGGLVQMAVDMLSVNHSFEPFNKARHAKTMD